MTLPFLLKTKRTIGRLFRKKPDNGNKVHAVKNIDLPIKIILTLATIGIITLIYPVSSVYQLLQVPSEGEIAPEDVIAPRNFQVLKSAEEIEQDKQLMRANQRLIFDYQPRVVDSVMVEFKRFFFAVDSLNRTVLNDSIRLEQFALQFPFLSSESQVTLSQKRNVKDVEEFLLASLTNIYDSGLVEKIDDLPFGRSDNVTIIKNNRENVLSKESILDIVRIQEKMLSSATAKFDNNPLIAKVIYDIGSRFLVSNLKADPERTEKAIRQKEDSISRYKGSVLKGEKIIGRNEKVTKEQSDKLRSLASAEYRSGTAGAVLPYVGRVLFIGFVFFFLGLFLYFFKRQIFESNAKLLMICLVILLEVGLSFVLSFKLGWSEYSVPVAIASLLLTILLDVEVGLVSTVALGLLLGVVYNFDFKITFITFIVGTLACYSVKEVQKRYRFYRPMLFVSFAYIIFIFFMEYLRYTPDSRILELCGIGLANGFLSVILSMGFLSIFESLFGITTDISLLELSDLNHPLLKRLALEAPGTYYHSIVVGSLAEAGSKEIGANALLARVGSYYHDIGKMKKPEYFVENQMGAKSKHDKLVPSMSALILESHVKEGVDLALEANLPDVIIGFIEQHHGTSIMTYFYSKALQQGATPKTIDEFRYPGPKPLSRETAIVMLADVVEAASRTLEEPKPSRIKNLITKIVADKFGSGELEECPLTLKDLHAVEDSFLPILIGVFHPRIDYPEKEEDVRTD